MRNHPQWRWHLYEVFVNINGKPRHLWRAVDHEAGGVGTTAANLGPLAAFCTRQGARIGF